MFKEAIIFYDVKKNSTVINLDLFCAYTISTSIPDVSLYGLPRGKVARQPPHHPKVQASIPAADAAGP